MTIDLGTRVLGAIEEIERAELAVLAPVTVHWRGRRKRAREVLRRCAADRKILRLHGVGLDGGDTMAHECAYTVDGVDRHDVWIGFERTCETIRLLAQGYGITEEADHG